MTKVLAGLLWFGVIGVYVASFFTTVAYAQSLLSPSYRFEESSLGNGGSIQSDSANFQSTISVGDTAIGSSASTNFQVSAGSKTTPDPSLTFSVSGAGVDFGSFTASAATVATTTFSVSNYTSYGYVVQILGDPPSSSGHTIPAMTATGPSVAGEEQFGINLVANTSPVSVGANPDHGEFGFGSAAASYGTSNQYRYVSGETIASAPKSSGVTTYTISYLVNVGSLTPGGKYTTNQELICTGTF